MGLNKQTGNMYPWVTHTWNPIKGKCPHDCEYCYMKVYPLKPVRLDESEFKIDLGAGNTIFIGSSCDMWADDIPGEWIQRITEYISEEYYDNTYLFQSKNPKRFFDFCTILPDDIIFGTTLETNRKTNTNAPQPSDRVPWMWEFTDQKHQQFKRMVSIEPIMDFDIREFEMMLMNIRPHFVSIGADSKGHNLSEPSKEKTLELIEWLKTFTEVRLKDNLKRILNY
jgi:DNA repair photolyase